MLASSTWHKRGSADAPPLHPRMPRRAVRWQDRHLADTWVVCWGPGLRSDLVLDWQGFQAARSALASTASAAAARDQAAGYGRDQAALQQQLSAFLLGGALKAGACLRSAVPAVTVQAMADLTMSSASACRQGRARQGHTYSCNANVAVALVACSDEKSCWAAPCEHQGLPVQRMHAGRRHPAQVGCSAAVPARLQRLPALAAVPRTSWLADLHGGPAQVRV